MSDAAIASIRTRLRRFKGKYPDICERAGLQYSWLSKFASGERGARPSFDLITKLEAALTEFEAAEAVAATDTTVPNEDPSPPPRRTTAAKGETAKAVEIAPAVTRQSTTTH
jgi:transcriptional regulator with XRE-family HTH domain